MLERVPAVEQLAGLQVVLLHRRVDQRAVVGAAVLRQVHREVLVGGHPRVVAADHELVQREHPAVGSGQRRDRPVVLVDDHVLAALGRSGVRDHALPPSERRLAVVRLEAEVARHDVLGDRLEPHRLQLVVEDQRPALADHRRVVEVVEVRHEDVAGGQELRVGRHVRAGSPADAARAPRRTCRRRWSCRRRSARRASRRRRSRARRSRPARARSRCRSGSAA